jgi:hypothetical protein
MKSAEEWVGNLRGAGDVAGELALLNAVDIRAIQADALRHAAEICRTVVLCNECASLCEAEAERLSKP